jgi:putative pyruvate formate lyase activating enzyme
MRSTSRRSFLRTLITLPAAVAAPGVVLSGGFQSAKSNAYTKHMAAFTPDYQPSYIRLHRNGDLKARGELLYDMMRRCTLCPRECQTNRIRGRRGDCKANANLEVSSSFAHFGEEAELVGKNGSGTIFFTNCSLLCVFCINYEVSHLGQGRVQSIESLSNMMLQLQRRGCHNINVVTPSHYVPHILLALDRAASKGLHLPLVYNTCGWEKQDVLQLLDGVVDIYLADFKYGDTKAGAKYSSGADSYTKITQEALLEMHQQVGLAISDPDTGLIYRGLMIRHLVMPDNVARTDLVIRWIAGNLPKNTYVNIMSQYTPLFKAFEYPEIARRITHAEYNEAIRLATQAGLTNFRRQMQ